MNEVQFKEQLNKIKENAVIDVSCWWGLSSPGYMGTLITKDKEVYEYESCVPNYKGGGFEIENSIEKIKELTDEEYKKIILFIENEIIDKQFEFHLVMDAGWSVDVNYNGIKKGIGNERTEIYEKAKNLINELLNTRQECFTADLKKEKTKRNIFLILQMIFLILTFVGAILVIMKKVDNAGYAVIPMLFSLIFSIFARQAQKKINENFKK